MLFFYRISVPDLYRALINMNVRLIKSYTFLFILKQIKEQVYYGI
jgi:hypothetical protein